MIHSLEYSEVVYGPLVYGGSTLCLKLLAPGFEDAGSSPAGSTTPHLDYDEVHFTVFKTKNTHNFTKIVCW